MKLREFVQLYRFAANKSEIQAKIEKMGKPKELCGKVAPVSLNDINFGQLMRLQHIQTDAEFISVPCEVLLGLSESDIMNEDADKVIAFSAWVGKEVKRISELFAKASVPPTNEEKQAGIESLSFGPFGLYDWYARRMGITDHTEVDNVPWIRVYKCLEMDAKRTIFERKLKTILSKKKK